MQSVHEILEEIKRESPDLFEALEKVIINARIALAVKKVQASTDSTEHPPPPPNP